MLCRKLKLLKKVARAEPERRFRLPTRIGTAQSAQWRWTKTVISLQRLQPAAQPTNDQDALAIRQLSAQALTQTTPHALFPRRATANILSAQRSGVMFRP